MSPYIIVYLLYVCNLSSKSLPYSDMRYPKYLKSFTCSIIFLFINFYPLYVVLHIAIVFVFVLDMVILYFIAIRFKCCAIVCKSRNFKNQYRRQSKVKVCSYWHIRLSHMNKHYYSFMFVYIHVNIYKLMQLSLSFQ